MPERILVAVAWPYANGPCHIGHLAGAYLPGDTFARFHRLVGNEVLMVSGSDMHGTPVAFGAEKEGLPPSAVAERFHAIHGDTFERIGLSFDLYTHTHTAVHERTVQEVFLVLLQKNLIDRRTEVQAYCPKDARFLPDRYVNGTCPNCGFDSARGDECDRCGRVLEPTDLIGARCTLCGSPAEFRPTEHFFLRLDQLAPELERYVADKGYWRTNVLETTRGFLQRGLKPRPITRDLTWGVPIPLDGYPTKRIYVWFEAVLGYLSASREWAVRKGDPDAWKRFWDASAPVRQYYFVGKDNIFFHTLLWPAILTGYGGLRLPYDVPANEWLQVEGQRLSKSRSSDATAFLPSLLAHYPPDQIRFYATALAPQNHDTEFDWDEFHRLSEDVLSNQYGNLVQRVLVFARDHCDGRVPFPPSGWSADRPGGVGERVRRAHAEVTALYEAVRIKEAFERALTEVREENRAFQEAKPWQADPASRDRTVYEALWLLKAAAVWLSPVLPFSSAELWRMLGLGNAPGPGDWGSALVPPAHGQAFGEVVPLFPRREAPVPAAPVNAPRTVLAPPAGSDFVPLAIQAAEVVQAVPHPQADKLYVLTLDTGGPKPRTVVAGLRPYYTEEALRGRRVVVLTNLEPRTIRRVTSQGMILAAESGGRVETLTPGPEVPPGAFAAGGAADTAAISHSTFETNPILVGTVTGAAGEDGRAVDVGDRQVTVTGRWPVGSRVVVQTDGPGGQRGRVIHFASDALLVPPPELPAGSRVR